VEKKVKKKSLEIEMKKRKVIFTIEVDIKGRDKKELLKKTREARKVIKTGVNSVKDVKATRITNKDQ